MTRVKRGIVSHKKREKTLKKVKGYRWGRKTKERAAKEALLHGLSRKFEGRKEKKRTFRSLWQTKINAGVREQGMSYSKFIGVMKKQKIELDRKVLAELAEKHPETFKKIVEELKNKNTS